MAVPTQSQLDYYYYFALRVFFSVFMKKTKRMQETERQICETAAVVRYVDNLYQHQVPFAFWVFCGGGRCSI